MTKEEKRKVVEEALSRAYLDLDAAEHLLGKDTHYLMCTIRELEMLRELLNRDGECAREAVDAPVIKQPKPETSAPVEEPAPSISKDEMRTKLAELGDKCSDNVIPGVMKSMGYDKLSQVPAARYAELLENVAAAVKEAK